MFNDLDLISKLSKEKRDLKITIDDLYKTINGFEKIKTVYKDVLFEKNIQKLNLNINDPDFNKTIKENRLKDLLINLKRIFKKDDSFKIFNLINNNQKKNGDFKDFKDFKNELLNIKLIQDLIKNIEFNELNIQKIEKLDCEYREIDLKLKGFNVCPLCHQNIKHHH